MANMKDSDAPTTLTKTSLQGTFDIKKGDAFNQMSIQFDVQESKAIRRRDEQDVGTVDQFDSLAEYIAAENMKEYFGDFTNENDKKRADSFIRASQTNAEIGMRNYAQKQFSQYRSTQPEVSLQSMPTKREESNLYQHFQTEKEFLEYLNGETKVGAIASVYHNGAVQLFIISPFKQGFVRLGKYDPNMYVNALEK